ncbi:MAG: alpha/beta fold hydrolase [Vicinamibacterales bacterium]|nr:alpha/beta fold hydrolase [Vicinamibacterales bacterium]
MTYEFGAYRLDVANARLEREGAVVPLPPKAFALLQCLLERAGRLVTKPELLETVWAGTFVGDAALKVAIRDVRRALGDDAAQPAFIETAHRRGYRFIAPVTVAAPPVPSRPAATPPATHYARSGDVNIAYQVVGDGPIDLVFVMGWVSHLDYFWAEPSFAAFLTRLASFSRLILFDKRGTGLSDPVTALPTLEQRMDDVRAVLEAVGSTEAALLGVSEGGPMCALFAATYPERTRALVTFGTYARRLRADDYPWGPTPEERDAFCQQIRDHWGDPVGLDTRAPSRVNDPDFRAWWATYLRMGASPGTAIALTRMNAEVDVRHVLPAVRVPTLVLHRRGDRCLLVEEGRYVAEQIPGARFVELDGDDHLPFAGDQESVLGEIEAFLTGEAATSALPGRLLATVLRLVIDGDGPGAAVYDDALLGLLRGGRGTHASASDEGITAIFDGPGRAIACARTVAAHLARAGRAGRIGLHTGECTVAGGHVTGLAVTIASPVAHHARPGEVVASRTLRDLLAGSAIEFEDRGARPVGPVGEAWDLYAV